jgi:hypothetical protein
MPFDQTGFRQEPFPKPWKKRTFWQRLRYSVCWPITIGVSLFKKRETLHFCHIAILNWFYLFLLYALLFSVFGVTEGSDAASGLLALTGAGLMYVIGLLLTFEYARYVR